MRTLILVVVVVSACERKPDPGRVDPVAEPTLSMTGSDVAAVAKPVPAKRPRVPPAKQIAWTTPKRAPNSQEQLLAGTWAATVGEYATRSLYMADRVVLAVDGKGKDLVGAITDALERDNRIQTSCIWLELRPDFTGIRRECMLVNGSPNALDQNDVMTGKKSDLGTKLDWFVDESDKNAIKIHFHDDMVIPAAGPAGLRELVFRNWTLRFDKEQGANRFTMTEYIPEHDYTVPTKYVYEIHSGAYLDGK